MPTRHDVATVLTRCFPGATREAIAAAASEVLSLEDEWEEIGDQDSDFGYQYSVQCSVICHMAREVEDGTEFRVFRRRT